jgi:hypothetical protein
MLAKGDMARSVWKPQLTRHLRSGWSGVYQGGQGLPKAESQIRGPETTPGPRAQNALMGPMGRTCGQDRGSTTERFRTGDLDGLPGGGLCCGIVHAAIDAETFRKGRRFRGAEFL